MTTTMTEIQRYFCKYADFKKKLSHIVVNGKEADVYFNEYAADPELIETFMREAGDNGHYFYITIRTKYYDNYWKEDRYNYVSYLTTKEEGNQIYKAMKTNKHYDITEC